MATHQRKQCWSLTVGALGLVEGTQFFLVSGQFGAISNALSPQTVQQILLDLADHISRVGKALRDSRKLSI